MFMRNLRYSSFSLTFTTKIGLAMSCVAMLIFLTMTPSEAYSTSLPVLFEGATCTYAGQSYDEGACRDGQRCWVNQTNGYSWWQDDDTCPCSGTCEGN